MTHFGIICPAETGHLNTLLPLGRELQRRGHRVTLIGILDAQSKTLAAGLEFWAISESESPLGTMSQTFEKLGELSGLAALRYTISVFTDAAAQLLQDAPAAIKQAGIEALLVDQTLSVGGTIAEYIGIPFISVCSALVLNGEENIPPFFTSWNYNPVWWARIRNQAAYSLVSRIAQPIIKVVSEYRQEWNLPLHSSGNDPFSKLATVSQQPAELEFPRKQLPQSFHFTGSLS
jgi:UDP:flavonoid glycosyltransferase YjiC (YdhE family)